MQLDLRGIGYGEKIRGLDVRPSTGVLYAVTDADRVYTIDLKARRATPTGPAFMPPTLGEYGGFDFNPVPDKIRLTTDANENRRIEPANGATLAIDKPLMFAATDANMAVDPAVVGSAYTNPDNDPATGTTLYGIDAASDSLVKQDPPNDGVLTTVGKLGVNVGAYKAGFDIAPGNTGWALLRPRGGKPGLYTVDITTGATKRVLSSAGTASRTASPSSAPNPLAPRPARRAAGRPERAGPRSPRSSHGGFRRRAGGALPGRMTRVPDGSAQSAAAESVVGAAAVRRDSSCSADRRRLRPGPDPDPDHVRRDDGAASRGLGRARRGGRRRGADAIVAFTSSDVRPGRVRLAVAVAVAALLVAFIAEQHLVSSASSAFALWRRLLASRGQHDMRPHRSARGMRAANLAAGVGELGAAAAAVCAHELRPSRAPTSGRRRASRASARSPRTSHTGGEHGADPRHRILERECGAEVGPRVLDRVVGRAGGSGSLRSAKWL